MDLVWPDRQYLPDYVDALRRRWSPDEHRADARRSEELARIEKDADGFVRQQVDREAERGHPANVAGWQFRRPLGARSSV